MKSTNSGTDRASIYSPGWAAGLGWVLGWRFFYAHLREW
jgi:hypothetical protein